MMPARVLAIDGDTCEVASGDRIDRVSLLLAPPVDVDDWVLVFGGTVARRLEPEQAAQMRHAVGLAFGEDT